MKNSVTKSLLLSLLLLLSLSAQAQNSCQSIFLSDLAKVTKAPPRSSKAALKGDSEFAHLPLEDQFIIRHIGNLGLSSIFWGKSFLSPSAYGKALDVLRKDSEFSVETLQKAHRLLTNNKATLQFRGTSEAKVLGTYSFKAFSALTPHEVKQIENNPFLSFIPAKEVTRYGVLNKEIQIGDIVFPNYLTVSKFKDLLSKPTLEAATKLSKEKSPDEQKVSVVNQAILKDLAAWTLQEAQQQINTGREASPMVLALLEWRLKSLGLYYEGSYISKGSYIESSMGRMDLNRSMELAEVVVDAFAEVHNITDKGLQRAYRPQLTDSITEWASYMKESLQHRGVKRVSDMARDLEKLSQNMSPGDAAIFQTYYQTRLMAGVKSSVTAESILQGFKEYKSRHYNKEIPEKSRALLIPIEFIKNFDTLPASLKEYYASYYFQDSTLFRGVSNSSSVSDKSLTAYFKSYRGRFASELSRSIFAKRVEFAKLSMLQFNADLIHGRAVESASQHAAKHMGYEPPNSAKTYFASATDLSTIAFRFAMDKGYVDRSSSTAVGNTHMVFEFLSPKYGVMDFGHLKLTDPSWKNYFPRQRETSIAGGLDPNSLIRIYILAPYAAGEKAPANGPEKHGKIIKMFERDYEVPEKVHLKQKNKDGQWEITETYDLRSN